MPYHSEQIPRVPGPACICTALYYNDDCPKHGRMYRAWQRNRRVAKHVTAALTPPALTPPAYPSTARPYPLVKLWLWLERATAGRLR